MNNAVLKRAARGLDAPAGTIGQENAAMKAFQEFLDMVGNTKQSQDDISIAFATETSSPLQNMYSLLTAFGIYLQTKKSSKSRASDGLLSKATALGYYSQVVNLLREKYPHTLTDSKRIGKIKDKMGAAIEERNLRCNIQTNVAPSCKLDDLLVLVNMTLEKNNSANGMWSVHDAAILTMMWHIFGRAIDTCFARKSQLSIASSGELFLRHWQQCVLHAFGMLSVCASEPSEYIFRLIPRSAVSDLPGETPYSQEEAIMYRDSLLQEQKKEETCIEKNVFNARARPNISKYTNNVIHQAADIAQRRGHALTANFSSHSIRRGAAAYANGSAKLAIQWISTRGAWLLESLTNAFAYIGTTTKEDQSVGKVLAGYRDPDFPVATPTINMLASQLPACERGAVEVLKAELFRNVSGFTDASANLNVAPDVLNAVFASLLIHLQDITAAEQRECNSALSQYTYHFQSALQQTNSQLGTQLTLGSCCEWGVVLKSSWQLRNHLHVGRACAEKQFILHAAITQLLELVGSLRDSATQLQAGQEHLQTSQDEMAQRLLARGIDADEQVVPRAQAATAVIPVATSLAGVFYNWHVTRLWQVAADKKEQTARSEVKSAIKIMKILYQDQLVVPDEPPKQVAALHKDWEQQIWMIGKTLDQVAYERLHNIDRKMTTSCASSLRKRWRNIALSYPDHYAALTRSQPQSQKQER